MEQILSEGMYEAPPGGYDLPPRKDPAQVTYIYTHTYIYVHSHTYIYVYIHTHTYIRIVMS